MVSLLGAVAPAAAVSAAAVQPAFGWNSFAPGRATNGSPRIA
jgi:hypothetical protein